MEFGPEQTVHGSPWGRMHGGYFSDPAVAEPLVEAVREICAMVRPGVIVDLGGGTGFLLSRLRELGASGMARLVDLDASVAQLEEARAQRLTAIEGTVGGFRRRDIAVEGESVMWLMRSVLHYAGEEGLGPLLKHVRAQAAEGERWVHQTACFERGEDASCLNELYRRMRTGKWYPTVAGLRSCLERTEWRVEDIRPAAALPLESDELGMRYGIGPDELQTIGRDLAEAFGKPRGVLEGGPVGFRAHLHYRIWICVAG